MTWRKREIMDMARQVAGMITIHANGEATYSFYEYQLKAFAKLVREDEREKFCAVLRQLHDSYSLASDPNGIRARSNHD
jgi:hypothetical protein